MATNIKMVIEGLVKSANKAKKNAAMWGIKPEDKPVGPSKFVSKRQLDHKAKRGLKTKQQFAENFQDLGNTIYEGLVKAANKAKKKDLEVSKGAKAYDSESVSPRVAGAFGKAIKHNKGKAGDKVTKGTHAALRAKARESLERFESMLLEAFAKKIVEGVTDTDDDSITNAGGSAEAYRRIKAQKDAKAGAAAKPQSTRKEVLGKMGGFRDRKNQPYKKPNTIGTEKHKGSGQQTKPLPLNLKGKPSQGKKVNPDAVRGKSVNTSRGSGKEGDKATASGDAFNKLVQNLQKSKKD